MRTLHCLFVFGLLCGMCELYGGLNNENKPVDEQDTDYSFEEEEENTHVLMSPLFLSGTLVDAYVQVLFDLVYRRKLKTFKTLLDESVDDNSKRKEYLEAIDSLQWNLLHYAAQNGDLKMIRLLLKKYREAGGSRKKLIRTFNGAGKNAIQIAFENGHYNAVVLLLSYFEGYAGELYSYVDALRIQGLPFLHYLLIEGQLNELRGFLSFCTRHKKSLVILREFLNLRCVQEQTLLDLAETLRLAHTEDIEFQETVDLLDRYVFLAEDTDEELAFDLNMEEEAFAQTEHYEELFRSPRGFEDYDNNGRRRSSTLNDLQVFQEQQDIEINPEYLQQQNQRTLRNELGNPLANYQNF